MGANHQVTSGRVATWVALSGVFGFLLASTAARPTVPSAIPSSITPQYPATNIFTGAIGRAAARQSGFGNPVRGAVVNHHLLAADFIADTLSQVSRQEVDRIVIIAPNHFEVGYGRVSTTNDAFATPFGMVMVDQPFVTALSASQVVVESRPFFQEHGVFNIVPFLAHYFPGVRVVPLIVRSTATPEQIDRLVNQLVQQAGSRTLFIASLDFAHLQTDIGADGLDLKSLDVLQHYDVEGTDLNRNGLIAVDSPGALRMFLGVMRKLGATSWTLTHHSNSAKETNQLAATNVTSHITGLFRRFPTVVH